MDSSADDDGKESNTQQALRLPEETLNTALLCTAFVYKAMNGLGTLATIWATVVLLGGFSTLIKQQDFWYVTVIGFVQSIGVEHEEGCSRERLAGMWERGLVSSERALAARIKTMCATW
ncbi:hypothetical protein ACP70R_045275 [Stipagrostis hirtigluma subsp. patula]